MEIKAGDILFYAVNAQPDIYDRAIVIATQSKWIHVAIAINHVQKIESLSGGIMINFLDNRQVDGIYNSSCDPLKLHNALNWLVMQKGNSYSWGDAANVMLEYLHSPIMLAEGNLVFCSGLATEFLQKCGFIFPDNVMPLNPHLVSPAILAKILDVK